MDKDFKVRMNIKIISVVRLIKVEDTNLVVIMSKMAMFVLLTKNGRSLVNNINFAYKNRVAKLRKINKLT